MRLLVHMAFWHWWILSVVLLAIQIINPGRAYFISTSIGAGIIGVVLLLAPQLGWQWQALIFSTFSLAAIGILEFYVKRHPLFANDSPTRNSATKLLDRSFTLSEPINNGMGKLQVDDMTYAVEGADMPGGSTVRVVGFENAALRVRKVTPS